MMKSELVVKSNRLIEASYRLDLVEQRVILMAIIEARNTGHSINAEAFIEVRASDFAATFKTDERSSYARLRSAADTLFNRWILLRGIDETTGKPMERKTRWVSTVDYIDGAGLIRIQFAPVVIPYITRLESEFTSYHIGAVSQMSSSYAIRLYELLIQWGSTGSRVLALDELKEILQVTKDYGRISDLKKRVIDLAVEQINQHSDLSVSYSQRKSGRTVTHLIFTFSQKPQPTKPPKIRSLAGAGGMSKKEIERLARPGETYEEAEERIRKSMQPGLFS
jgi:plasmid replication initiation protein